MRICIDVQHAGKPHAPLDRGAVSPLGYTEADVTRDYALAMEQELEAAGHEVFVIRDGEYVARHARVNLLDPDLYLACHANAGLEGRTGDRTELYHWPGSAKGAAAAELVMVSLLPSLPWPCRVLQVQTVNQRNCIAGVRAPALLLEVGFVDGEIGAAWLERAENRALLGRQIADGVSRWAAS